MNSDYRRVDLPQTPTPAELAQTIHHLTGRPPDQREMDQLQRQLNVPQNTYAPGGETSRTSRTIR